MRAKATYLATLLARVVILAGFVGLYAQTSDPLFFALLAVVLVGFVLTLSAYLADAAALRRRSGRKTDGGLV